MADGKPRSRAIRESATQREERLRLLRMARLREEFRTLKYRNSGAYSSGPTVRGNLPERPPEFVAATVKIYEAIRRPDSLVRDIALREALAEADSHKTEKDRTK